MAQGTAGGRSRRGAAPAALAAHLRCEDEVLAPDAQGHVGHRGDLVAVDDSLAAGPVPDRPPQGGEDLAVGVVWEVVAQLVQSRLCLPDVEVLPVLLYQSDHALAHLALVLRALPRAVRALVLPGVMPVVLVPVLAVVLVTARAVAVVGRTVVGRVRVRPVVVVRRAIMRVRAMVGWAVVGRVRMRPIVVVGRAVVRRAVVRVRAVVGRAVVGRAVVGRVRPVVVVGRAIVRAVVGRARPVVRVAAQTGPDAAVRRHHHRSAAAAARQPPRGDPRLIRLASPHLDAELMGVLPACVQPCYGVTHARRSCSPQRLAACSIPSPSITFRSLGMTRATRS